MAERGSTGVCYRRRRRALKRRPKALIRAKVEGSGMAWNEWAIRPSVALVQEMF
jgi:hypothetical protein